MKRRFPLLSFVAMAACLATTAAALPQPATDTEAEETRVDELISEIKQLTRAMRQSGEELAREDSAARARILELWEIGLARPSAEAGVKARGEALHLLVHIDRHEELIAKSETLPADDPAWRQAMDVLLESARFADSYDHVLAKAEARLAEATEADERAQLWFVLAEARRATGRSEAAIEAYREAAAASPGSQFAARAEGYVHELLYLNPGQPAPDFFAPTLAGDMATLSGYRGKVVLMSVWASW